MKEKSQRGFCAKGIGEIRGIWEIVNYARDGEEARRLIMGALVESISVQDRVFWYAARLILRIHGGS